MIAIGCDHGALELKEQLIEHLKKRGVECKDYGTYTKDSCDYPVYAKKVAEAILSGECEEGILLCGTGIGMSMAANKIKGIRAALCSDCFSAQATKEHNNANVLCMGARVIGPELAFRIADTFLDSKFSNDERHIRRTLDGAKMYVTLFPCNECAKAIIQAGIKTIVYDCDKYADTASVIASKRMLNAAGVRYYKYESDKREVTLQL